MIHFCIPSNLDSRYLKNIEDYKSVIDQHKDCDYNIFLNNLSSPKFSFEPYEILLNGNNSHLISISEIRNKIVEYSINHFKDNDYICFLDNDDKISFFDPTLDTHNLYRDYYFPEKRYAYYQGKYQLFEDNFKDYCRNQDISNRFFNDFYSPRSPYVTGILFKVKYLKDLVGKFGSLFFSDKRNSCEEDFLMYYIFLIDSLPLKEGAVYPLYYEIPPNTGLSKNNYLDPQVYIDYQKSLFDKFSSILDKDRDEKLLRLLKIKIRYSIGYMVAKYQELFK